MPSSHFRQINEIVEAIVYLHPKAVLDIGVGYAKYGLLAREYLDEAWCRNGVVSEYRIGAVEGFAEYIGPLHRLAYDNIYIGDAREILARLDVRYDLALLIDVIEHVEHDQGMQMLKAALQVCRNVLVSTPREFHAQSAVFGNQYEIHRSLWTQKDFAGVGPVCLIPNTSSIICVVGQNAPALAARIHSWRRRLARQLPWAADAFRYFRSRVRTGATREAGDETPATEQVRIVEQ